MNVVRVLTEASSKQLRWCSIKTKVLRVDLGGGCLTLGKDKWRNQPLSDREVIKMKVLVWFDRSSVPITYNKVSATYQKGDMFCIRYDGFVDKYPIKNIFKIREEEFDTSQP